MNVDYVEALVRLGGALAVLSALLAGQGGRWPRARQRLARALSSVGRTSRGSSSAAGPSSGETPHEARERRRALLRDLAVALCLAIVLFALATNLRDEFSSVDSGRVHAVKDF